MRGAAAFAAALAATAVACGTDECRVDSKPLRGREERREVAVRNGYVGFVDVNGRYYQMQPPAPPTGGGLPSPGPFVPLPDATYEVTFRESGAPDAIVAVIDVQGTPRAAPMDGPLFCG